MKNEKTIDSRKRCKAVRSFVTGLVIAVLFVLPQLQAESKNGFDLSGSLVDPGEIFFGGPPRDGIPSIDNPKFIPVDKVDFLKEDDIVIGLVQGKIARAYPTRILVWHEIVNDTIGNEAVVVTYCPLCGTAMVFEREVAGIVRTFGVSGLLYHSDVLMYDRETESLWSQLAMKAISGRSVGKELTWLPSRYTTWKAWRKKYPRGQVLSTDTGHVRNYGGKAYASYFSSDRTMFPVPHVRKELPNKAWVVGIIVNGRAKAYPVDQLPSNRAFDDLVDREPVVVLYDAESRHPSIKDQTGKELPTVLVFWFAWQAFYPDTELWMP